MNDGDTVTREVRVNKESRVELGTARDSVINNPAGPFFAVLAIVGVAAGLPDGVGKHKSDASEVTGEVRRGSEEETEICSSGRSASASGNVRFGDVENVMKELGSFPGYWAVAEDMLASVFPSLTKRAGGQDPVGGEVVSDRSGQRVV